MGAIFRRELRTYLSTPTGWVFLGLFLLISGIYFSFGMIIGQNSDYASFLSSIQFIFLIIVPILTMRLVSEEKRLKTDQLLFTSPVKVSDIVIGKFLASLVLFLIAFAVIFAYSIVIIIYGDFQVATSVGAALGFILLGGSLISVGLLISAMTESQTVSAVATFVVLLLIYILEPIMSVLPQDNVSGIAFLSAAGVAIAYLLYSATKNLVIAASVAAAFAAAIALTAIFVPSLYAGLIASVLGWFSLMKRQQSFSLGLIKLDDAVYYVSFIAAFLFLSVRFVEKRRWM